MDPSVLVENYPELYHMAERQTWGSIQRHGLRSTSALLDLFEVETEARRAIESCHRPTSVTISHPIHGTAVIRDQKPMDDKGLIRALGDSGLSPADWYRLLNSRVFFWLRKERLQTLLNAELYRNNVQLVLTIDTARLIAAYGSVAELSPMNSGCTKPFPHPRDHTTFSNIADYPFGDRRKTRPLSSAVVEFTIPYSVDDIRRYVTRVEHRRGDAVLETLY